MNQVAKNPELDIQERIQQMRKKSACVPHRVTPEHIEPPSRPKVKIVKQWEMKEAAVQLNIGFKELFAILRDKGHFTKVGKNNLPTPALIEKGYFKNELKKFSRGSVSNSYTKTYVTPNGMSFLQELVKEHKQKEKTCTQK